MNYHIVPAGGSKGGAGRQGAVLGEPFGALGSMREEWKSGECWGLITRIPMYPRLNYPPKHLLIQGCGALVQLVSFSEVPHVILLPCTSQKTHFNWAAIGSCVSTGADAAHW